MKRFFYPESMVVIGVSLSKISLGTVIIYRNVRKKFQGRLYGIGSREGELEGVKIYSSIDNLPEVPDVAVIITPAPAVPGMVESCGRLGITRVVIESGGFSEFSSQDDLEGEILSIARQYDMKIIGPNCLGVLNNENNLVMPFGLSEFPYRPGRVSVISQSGGVALSILSELHFNHIDTGKLASIGNKLQIDESDFLEYLLGDEQSEVLCFYLEGFKRGRRFFDLAMTSRKPIIVMKSNRSALSARIAQSHTASLSGEDDVVDAAFKQSGIIRADDEEGLVLAAKAMHLPIMKGRRVAVLSRSGGHAVISADACSAHNFDLAPFPEEFIQKINTLHKARVISYQNPMDLGDIFDFTINKKILEETLRLKEVDGVLFMHGYQGPAEAERSRKLLDDIMMLSKKYDKPVTLVWSVDPDEHFSINRDHPYPIFKNPYLAARALDISAAYFEKISAREARGSAACYDFDNGAIEGILSRCTGEGRPPLINEALEICRAAGFNPARHHVIHSINELENIREDELEYPVAAKLISRDASHKSDVGGVRLNIRNCEELFSAISGMNRSALDCGLAVDGFLIQEMARPGTELIIGGKRDPVFGPLVMAGLGGVFVEIFRDRSIRLAPVTKEEAHDMLSGLRSYDILRGTRGSKPLDKDAAAEAICRVSRLLADNPGIAEIDLNPVILYPEGNGAAFVDARIFITPAEEKEPRDHGSRKCLAN